MAFPLSAGRKRSWDFFCLSDLSAVRCCDVRLSWEVSVEGLNEDKMVVASKNLRTFKRIV